MKYIILVAAIIFSFNANAADEKADIRLAELNKKILLDFLKSSKTDNYTSFYNNYSDLTGKISLEAFRNKFDAYKDLPDDIAAIEASEFATHEVTMAQDNKYCPGKALQAKSLMKIQIVQDGHKYTITNQYCPVGGDYKVVSFKMGYMEN